MRTARTFRVPGAPLYVIGTFDPAVSVFSQQVRAVNLAWSLMSSRQVRTDGPGDVNSIAVVGGGFAGLTVAAGFLARRAWP